MCVQDICVLVIDLMYSMVTKVGSLAGYVMGSGIS